MGNNTPEIKRVKIGSLTIYEISENELESLEKGSPGSILLNFAIFLLSLSIAFIVAVLTTDKKSDLTFIIFIVLIVVFSLFGILLLLIWNKNRKSVKSIGDTIREREPDEEIPDLENK